MDKNISNIISETCKKEGINYKSCNPNYIYFHSDAQQLVQLYRDLQQIIGKLYEISERHDIPELKEMINVDIENLCRIDHDLVKLATKMKEESK